MRFINHKNKLSPFNITLIFLLLGNCLISVSCQTKEERTATILKKCQDFLDQDKVQDASTCYGDAVKANPDNGLEISKAGEIAVFQKCNSFIDKKDFRSAIACFDGFTALEPNMANNYFQLAYSYYQFFKEERKTTGKPDLELLEWAEEALQSGLKIKPDDATAHSLYGQIMADKGNKQKSLAEHQIAVKLSPKTIIFWHYYVIALEKFGEYEEGIEVCYQGLEVSSEDTLLLDFLGNLYERVGKPNKAIETYEKLLKIQPNDEVKVRLENLKKQKQNKQLKKKAKTVGSPVATSN